VPKRLALVDLYEELAEVLHIPTRILRGPAASCASSAAGLSLVEHQDQLQVVTAPSAASWVARFLEVRNPSRCRGPHWRYW